ncbi:phosphate ABC transporter ATP-binding protein, PhoT family [Thermosyntropha lipolytica DSM 11003]|uniref:Phosphate ABC transporter ATP-binding protein, PhoT family n=1 Tax=Thermosyntropha lipolytica DSM 11003 TaxID=1123382 RepID=A0A1M5NBZ6_9FIRM|nr:phosphate ABC transporter ATP-binding protein [Thermosyntropha lipolytica]SHG87084.1 phosphate ABC transporter ATP-binding protein, PhoT family [Thermosyntropha lipolytica DSM 11003]
MDEILRLENVKKKYGERTVLDIDYLQIKERSICALLGPNGSGKTTLLKILNFLEKPDAGSLFFRGKKVGWERNLEIARMMSMVFQKPFMFRGTVYQNLAYGLKLRGMSKKEIAARVKEVLSFVGMEGFKDFPAWKMSGGESQRIAIARALALKPKILFLDEPTANLDPHSVQAIERIVKDLPAVYGTTVIIVTHNLFQARRVADECVLLIEGRIVEKGKTESFFTAPQKEETRAFLTGTMVY